MSTKNSQQKHVDCCTHEYILRNISINVLQFILRVKIRKHLKLHDYNLWPVMNLKQISTNFSLVLLIRSKLNRQQKYRTAIENKRHSLASWIVAVATDIITVATYVQNRAFINSNSLLLYKGRQLKEPSGREANMQQRVQAASQ